mgnify:FL=1
MIDFHQGFDRIELIIIFIGRLFYPSGLRMLVEFVFSIRYYSHLNILSVSQFNFF